VTDATVTAPGRTVAEASRNLLPRPKSNFGNHPVAPISWASPFSLPV
jgi:hypothetical protein